jgi:cytochrome d ubiquinol oxidase subunit II
VHLAEVPLLFALIGLAFYTVLGGADFGAAIWQLAAGRGPRGEEIRDHAHHAMGPVWEANHVWLVFVLTVVWTSYPVVFGSVASTLSIPLFVAGLGIVLRGTAYALRSGASSSRELGRIDAVFSVSSILTPLALGAAVGGIASRRVPVGNAVGDLDTSWFNPTSAAIGILAVAFTAYVSAVFLSADAVRRGRPELESAFRRRALVAGVLAGAIAVAAILVVRSDAKPLYHGLVHGRGLAALVVSIVAGVATLAFVRARRYEPARYSAALAVAAVIAGWALAQSPVLLPGLTVGQAAAPRETLICVVVAVLAGGVILFPALALLFRLYLGGRFDPEAPPPAAERPHPRALVRASRSGFSARLAAALLLAGFGLLNVAESAWAHAVGAACLLGFVAVAFSAALPPREVSPPPPG